MSNDETYNIFCKEKDLKYAPYWDKVEKFLANPSYLVNNVQLMEMASREILTRLCASLQCFMEYNVAYNLGISIQDAVIGVIASGEDMDYKTLYESCEDRVFDIITRSKCSSYEDITTYRHIGTFLSDYLRSFIRLKRGADIFSDLLFSDVIITKRLEDKESIPDLLSFMSSLGPNIFIENKTNK